MATTLNKSIVESILLNENPSIDVKDPVIQDIAINFGADIIEEVDRRVTTLSSKFSSTYLSNLTSTELDIFALNVKGMSRKRGAFSTGYVYFIYKGLTNVSIPANTIVSTQDGVWEFYTTANIFIGVNDLQPYLNPLSNEYQIKVPIQSLNTGTQYNVSAYRLTYLKSSVTPAPSRVENREATIGGAGIETDADFVSRIEASIAGFNLNTKGGVLQALRSISTVTDINVIKRPQQNAFDVYFLGQSPVADTIIKTITNSSDRTIVFSDSISPVRYIDVIAVDGTVISNTQYSLSNDGSKVVLAPSVPLGIGSNVVISLQYNLVAQDVKGFINSNLDLIGTTWYVKEPAPFSLQINAIIKPLSSLTGSSSSYYQQTIASLINDRISGFFISSISSKDIESLIASNLSVTSAKITINNLPSVNIPEGYYPFVASDLITVTVI